jgi:hypothetical protein
MAQTTTPPDTSTATTTQVSPAAASGTDTTGTTDPLEDVTDITIATPKQEAAKPFYEDMRYIILILDGVLVIGMIFALIGRLLGSAIKAQTPYESRVVEEKKPVATAKAKQAGPVTLDQLNIDLPL